MARSRVNFTCTQKSHTISFTYPNISHCFLPLPKHLIQFPSLAQASHTISLIYPNISHYFARTYSNISHYFLPLTKHLIITSTYPKVLYYFLYLPTHVTLFRSFNLLKSTCYVTHQQFNIQQLYALPTLYLCVLYLSENKQRLVPLTA
jgi:hypothetical protein